MISIGSEISVLLQAGFPDGAVARSRTLYELVIKALVIATDESTSKVDLAERYSVSAALEAIKNYPASEESANDLLTKARQRWGSSFFEGDNNWALPAMGKGFKKKRVTFRDLEELLRLEDLRHMYVESNQAVHAGALRIVQGVDFRRNYLYTTGAEVDFISTGRVGQASAYYLEMATYLLAQAISGELAEPDCMLDTIDFLKNAQLANRLFREGYERPHSRSGAGSETL
jgi:hypothetical protein